jgi:hypothetical protein
MVDPFGAPLVGAQRAAGVLARVARRQRDVDFTVERHWVSGSTVLAGVARIVDGSGHGRVAGGPASWTAEVDSDGRIGRFREWALRDRRALSRGTPASKEQEDGWPETSRSTS